MTEMAEILLEEDFWREVESKEAGVDDDEGKGNVTDEGEPEADWLNEVGLGELSQQWRLGKSLPESDVGSAVYKLSLKPHQADAVRKRIRTLNATLKKRRKQRRPPDVRSFFQSEVPENKDSSRSATPDSLDSVELPDSSPPRRPASPNLENLLDRSDGGIPSFVSVFDNQPLSITSSQTPRASRDIFKHAIKFPIKGTATEEGEVATDDITGIEMLNYHNTGTIYMKGYLHSRKPILHPRPGTLTLNNQTNNQTNHSEVNNRTYNANAPPTGLTEELTKSHPVIDEELISENSFIDPSGQTRLSDLSEDDVRSLRPILLVELTAQCDHLSIQIQRRKAPKTLKKQVGGEETPNQVFGLTLDSLLAKDRKFTGDSSLQVPVAFEKMINHLWKRGLHVEGLLRMAGHKGKTSDLRATFESSLYTEPEQVEAAMSNCSPHDVANLLKQFIRELPVPLLGFEYIDTFFNVAGDLPEHSQKICLRLLILLLPLSHQAVFSIVIDFVRDLIQNSHLNKMSLRNVALILAPNLVPSSALSIKSREEEITRTATWVRLTEALIRHSLSLFVVPSDVLSQLRQTNDAVRQKKLKGMRKGFPIQPSSTLKVSAPQLGFPEVMLPVHAGTTAGDIVLFLLEEAERKAEDLEKERKPLGGVGSPGGHGNRRRGVGRGEFGKNPQGPGLSCLLAQINKDSSLKSHVLFEVGGNIGYRRVDPSALIPAIIRDNPSASWVLRCAHRHSSAQSLPVNHR